MLDTAPTLSPTIPHRIDDDDLLLEVVASDGPSKKFARFEPRVVPDYVYRVLSDYAEDYQAAFDRPLKPPSGSTAATKPSVSESGRR